MTSTLFFAWSPQDAPLEDLEHRHFPSAPTLYLEIDQKEEEPACAHVEFSGSQPESWGISNHQHTPLPSLFGLIYHLHGGKRKLIFRGRPLSESVRTSSGTSRLTFIAAPEDEKAPLAPLFQDYQKGPLADPDVDPLFFPPDHNPTAPDQDGRTPNDSIPYDAATMKKLILARQEKQLFWDPVTWNISLVDMFTGQQTHALHDRFLHKTLAMKTLPLPPRKFTCAMTATWIQRVRGYTNLTAPLKSLFPDGPISTYTGRDFEACWPKKGSRINQSGYWVAASHIEDISDPITSTSLPLPSFDSSDISDLQDETSHVTLARLSTFNTQLVLGWDYAQKRKEILTFTLHSLTQGRREKRERDESPESSLSESTSDFYFSLTPLDDISAAAPWCPQIFY